MSVFRFRVGRKWIVGLAAALAACAPRGERARSTVVDDFGDSVVARARPARIVSLSPATTEILFALGEGGRLVGRTHWDAYPESALAVPDLGDGMRPNVERILAARPDLVVLYAGEDNRDADRALRRNGAPVVALRLDRIADFARVTTLLGALTREEARARVLVDSVTRTLARVRAATGALPHPTVFLPAYEQPLLAIGGGSFLSELVDIAGGRNVFGDLPAPSPQVSFEELLRRDPDFVIAAPTTVARLRADPRWRALRAIREGHVLVRDTVITERPGVRLGDAAVSFARLLHPDVRP